MSRVDSYVVVWRVLVGVYVLAAVTALVIVNADQGDAPAAAGIVATSAVALGWGTASGWGAVVAWLLVPLALPFGDANQFSGGDGTDPVVLLAAALAAMSTVLILASGGARALYNRRHPSPRVSHAGRNGALPSLEPPTAIDAGLTEAPPINTPTAPHPTATQPTAAHRR